MLNNYLGPTTFNAANIASEVCETLSVANQHISNIVNNLTIDYSSCNFLFQAKEVLHTTDLLETKLEPHTSNINMQESSPSEWISDEHNYTLSVSEARQKLANELSRKEITIKALRKKLAGEKKRFIRQESLIRKLKLALSNVKQKALISEHLLQSFTNNISDTMLEILFRASGEQNTEYSEELKRFALNVYLYSPAAYRYLRESFNKCLPHVNMIRSWRAAAFVRVSPNTKLSSTTVKNYASDTAGQATLSQDIRHQTVLSPDLENQPTVSVDVEKQTVWSHNIIDHTVPLHDTATLSPHIEHEAISSPDIQDQAISSPDIQDQEISSPGIQDQEILSHDKP